MPAIVECEIPASSVLDRRWIEGAYFREAYRCSLKHPAAGVVEIFFAVFAHRPIWLKVLLIVRNRIAALCGLDAPKASEILRVEVGKHYEVGETIGAWPIFALTETELVAGRDNRHLDFRLSVLKEAGGETPGAVFSTICNAHNVYGKVYLFFVVPFHRWGMRRLIARGIASGRL